VHRHFPDSCPEWGPPGGAGGGGGKEKKKKTPRILEQFAIMREQLTLGGLGKLSVLRRRFVPNRFAQRGKTRKKRAARAMTPRQRRSRRFSSHYLNYVLHKRETRSRDAGFMEARSETAARRMATELKRGVSLFPFFRFVVLSIARTMASTIDRGNRRIVFYSIILSLSVEKIE